MKNQTNKHPRWGKEELDILHKNTDKSIDELSSLFPRRNVDSIKSKMLKEHLIERSTSYPGERQNERQIILRFVKYKKPNGTEGGTIGRSTITLVENSEEKTKDQEYWNDPKLWNKLRDWCLGKEGVKIGKATKTVTVNVLVTDGEEE